MTNPLTSASKSEQDQDRAESAPTNSPSLCHRKTTGPRGRSGCRMSLYCVAAVVYLAVMLVTILVGYLMVQLSQYRESMAYVREELSEMEQTIIRLKRWDLDKVTKNYAQALLFKPEQLHLSLGANYTERYVTWSTMAHDIPQPKYTSSVKYVERCFGLPDEWRSAPATMESKEVKELDPKWVRLTGRRTRTIYTYRAKLQGLKDGCLYYYKAQSYRLFGFGLETDILESDTYRFRAKNIDNPEAKVKLALYGDLGLVNSRSILPLTRMVDDEELDVIIHNGDFAYDLNDHHGEVGDEFMRKIEPIAARVPYQTSVGNHEKAQNFTHYDMRFTMINSGYGGNNSTNAGQRNNFFYSFNVGPVHFVAFSTEFYYFLDKVGPEPLDNQWEWLKKDLSHAASPSERAKRPWIIVFGHRPMYCSDFRLFDDCSKADNILRKGLPDSHKYALEKLFYDYGVDVELYAHEHNYERFLPIYDGQVSNGTDRPNDPYFNARAPVHVISGSAGCDEKLAPFIGKPAIGSVKRIADYGYTILEASSCQLRFTQRSDNQKSYREMANSRKMSGNEDDYFVMTKTRQNFPPELSGVDLDCGDQEWFQIGDELS